MQSNLISRKIGCRSFQFLVPETLGTGTSHDLPWHGTANTASVLSHVISLHLLCRWRIEVQL